MVNAKIYLCQLESFIVYFEGLLYLSELFVVEGDVAEGFQVRVVVLPKDSLFYLQALFVNLE